MTFAPPPQPVPPYGSAPGAPVPLPPAGSRRAPRGATALVVVGAVLLAVALVAAALGATLFVRALPTGVVQGDGSPGSSALASGTVPGEAEVAVSAGDPYTVWAVDDAGRTAVTTGDVAVTCDGSTALVGAPAVTGSSGAGATSARTVAEFTAPSDGSCTVVVAADRVAGPGSFVVTEGWRFGEFFATVGGTVLLWVLALGGGLLGLGLLVGGVVWRVVARR